MTLKLKKWPGCHTYPGVRQQPVGEVLLWLSHSEWDAMSLQTFFIKHFYPFLSSPLLLSLSLGNSYRLLCHLGFVIPFCFASLPTLIYTGSALKKAETWAARTHRTQCQPLAFKTSVCVMGRKRCILLVHLCTITTDMVLLLLITQLGIAKLVIFTDTLLESMWCSIWPGNSHCCIILFIQIQSRR